MHAEDPGLDGMWAIGDYAVGFQRVARVSCSSAIEMGVGRYGNLISNGIGRRLSRRSRQRGHPAGLLLRGLGIAEEGQPRGPVTDAPGVRNLTPVSFTVQGSTGASTLKSVVDAPGGFR